MVDEGPWISDLEEKETLQGSRPGNRYVRILSYPGFRRLGAGLLAPRESVGRPSTPLGRALEALKRLLIGSPLPSSQELQERLTKFKGLAIFASDNISSSAYASEEIMRVLVLAGALSLTMPITLAIIAVLAVVVLSYQQTIRSYPTGGGSYIVARSNLGVLPGLVAAAALLTDYVLTVAVSIAAGVAALTSLFPALFEFRVAAGVAFIAVLCLGNLRGIRESGTIFAGPTYIYLFAIFGLLGYGLWQLATGNLPHYLPSPERGHQTAGEPLTILLALRAFSSGSVALTGVEAVSNGVPAFNPPEARNAQLVLVLMGTFFGSIFLGISFLAGQLGVVPDPSEQETVVSQLTRTLVGDGSPYHYLVQFATAVLLVLAANTAFAGFPRLASILAKDRFLPRQFQFRGERLAFSTGIILLAFLGSVLVTVFEGSVTNLIPLYTVGVFLAFTLSQSGMVLHWFRERAHEGGWRWRAAINGFGAAATGLVMIVVGISKFALGAWIVMLLMPVLVVVLWAIHQHYERVESATVAETPVVPELIHPRVVLPIANLGIPARQAIAFARAIAPDNRITAVHVSDDPEERAQLRRAWEDWQPGIQLVIIDSPYRMLSGPLLAYVAAVQQTHPYDTITVAIPELVPSHWWEHLLHNQTALRIKAALLFRPGIVVVNVPYHLAGGSASGAPHDGWRGAGGASR
ncbi:MAG: APC family permease [Chloroflexi bacterium]|nr:APC family permease [Chloroflexota bacterium]